MKAIVCEKFAPVEELQYKEVATPEIQPGHVIIDIEAIGVNYPDGLLVQGLYQMKPPFPFTPGMEIAGTISEVGEGVTHLKVGQRVMGMNTLNGYAEKMLLPAQSAIPYPESIPAEEAAGLITAHATAHHALKQRANIQPSETLLVTGAAGGTGLAAVQIGKAMGAKVIALCSTQEKLDIAKANGADILINYTEVDLKATIKEVTEGKGVDVVYDVVGGETFDICSRSMAWNGRLLVIGFASGTIPSLPVNLTLVKGYSLVGVFWATFSMKQPETFMANMQELLTWYTEGRVKVHVDEVFPLKETVNALNKVMNRQVIGKVVLKP
ncbi:NADPH:quinone oxidoreductase family protein [Pseudomaricurvus alkylphenolicus]|uniref:NADPH:quinone oxidoreductase family protein n=1 Tax=Pseudomaricurvus alkylphenolicus TaxID=1306991 RepID=UPI00142435CF|nr:NADPH:quinone oxidoreductase family protein [Pseudomaricurvus alkylphenolicus]NIB44992.1 NADPH:quinone oxidoreductase family protein [Pseudomaricurvus alkylphenolicus]